jgi:pSer/pThr/pTyr-binding forkhead associated (FHA) protein
MASLFVVSGEKRGAYYPLGQRATVIGRDEALYVQVVDSQASRKHLQIYCDKTSGRYIAVDMKSTNGVFINDKKMPEEQALAEGDTIRIGQTCFSFTTQDFPDRENAMEHFKKVGERMRPTIQE